MRTLQLVAPGSLSLIDTPAPERPAPDEALVRVRRIGVCGTDLHAFRGRQPFFSYPRILGHELGVEVVETGDAVTHVRAGDHCSVEPYLNCGSCIACRRGKTNCCATLRVLGVHMDGGMREHITVPARKLHSSRKLTLDQLALVETLGIGCHAVHRAGLERNEYVAVIGAGPIGLAVMQFAVEAGARVIAVDINQARLDFCRRQLAVEHSVNTLAQSPLDALKEITGNDLPTAVFDATGNPQSVMSAFEYPAPGGRLILVGLFQGDVTFDDPQFHRRELTVMSSRNALSSDFTRIIALIESGTIDTTPWITHRSSFEDTVRAFPTWVSPESGVVKAMVEVD